MDFHVFYTNRARLIFCLAGNSNAKRGAVCRRTRRRKVVSVAPAVNRNTTAEVPSEQTSALGAGKVFSIPGTPGTQV